MATSNQDTNIKDVAAPASATPTNIGHLLGLNAAKTQDVLIPLSMLRQVIAQELQSALSAITSGSPNVPVLDGGNLKYMTLANFAKVAGELTWHKAATNTVSADDCFDNFGVYECYAGMPTGATHNAVLVYKMMPSWWAQICVTSNGIKGRLYNGGTGVWSSWT